MTDCEPEAGTRAPRLNPLREPHYGSGVGFCYEQDREIFLDASRTHGPLVIALDSNLVIDIQSHGAAVIDGVQIPHVDEKYRLELEALGDLIEMWFFRDIRFVILPGAYSDARRRVNAFDSKPVHRARMLDAIEIALTFQLDDWDQEDQRHPFSHRDLTGVESRALAAIPSALDRALVGQAVRCNADIFLTRDNQVISRSRELPAGYPKVMKPSGLSKRLRSLGDGPMPLGKPDHEDCVSTVDIPFGDSGKISALIKALDPYE